MTERRKPTRQELLDFIDRAFGDPTEEELDEIARLGREEPLPLDRARPFYARILKTLRPERSDEEIAIEVERILAAGPDRPATASPDFVD